MRGTVFGSSFLFGKRGITPAHAGNSRGPCGGRNCSGDHPRTCGEQNPGDKSLTILRGSPPHMRGTGISVARKINRYRITPAHAGNRHPLISSSLQYWDHPRTCGEQSFRWHRKKSSAGSPPHMRGTAIFAAAFHNSTRITPAHAGNSAHANAFFGYSKDHPRTCGEQLPTPTKMIFH